MPGRQDRNRASVVICKLSERTLSTTAQRLTSQKDSSRGRPVFLDFTAIRDRWSHLFSLLSSLSMATFPLVLEVNLDIVSPCLPACDISLVLGLLLFFLVFQRGALKQDNKRLDPGSPPLLLLWAVCAVGGCSRNRVPPPKDADPCSFLPWEQRSTLFLMQCILVALREPLQQPFGGGGGGEEGGIDFLVPRLFGTLRNKLTIQVHSSARTIKIPHMLERDAFPLLRLLRHTTIFITAALTCHSKNKPTALKPQNHPRRYGSRWWQKSRVGLHYSSKLCSAASSTE